MISILSDHNIQTEQSHSIIMEVMYLPFLHNSEHELVRVEKESKR